MDIAIERMTGIAFLVVAVSHIVRPRGWAEFFAQLEARGEPGAFINGMMALSLGAVIVAFHGASWSGTSAIVTVIGWGQVLKGLLNLCFPAYGLRRMATVPVEKSWKFVAAGTIMLPVAIAILWGASLPRS